MAASRSTIAFSVVAPAPVVVESRERAELAPTRYQSYVEILDELAPPPEDDTPVEPPEGG